MKIKNRECLLSRGDQETRTVLLELAERSLQSLDSYNVIKELVIFKNNILQIGDSRWDLDRKGRVFVVGAGKACNAMALAVDEILGDRITEGIVIVKKLEEDDRPKHIELVAGGHPLPNAEGLKASRCILDMVAKASPEDLFISLISGGSSALMSCPVPGITLEDERLITDQLLKCGARIEDINAVRRHISATNGGRLAQKIEATGAELINFAISDSVGDSEMVRGAEPANFRGTPVAPDRTTLQEARTVLRKFDLLSRAPRTVVEYLQATDPDRETPKQFSERVSHFVFRGTADSCEAALRATRQMGLDGLVLTTLLEGEARQAGTFLAAVAKEIFLHHRPMAPPCVLIAGGEITTTIDGPAGLGGPSQELALGFALEIGGIKGIAIAALDTDGTDGPSEYAGGVADGSTLKRAREMGLDVYDRLRLHDSSTVLMALGDEIITGNTGTNVCDVNIIYIAGRTFDSKGA